MLPKPGAVFPPGWRNDGLSGAFSGFSGPKGQRDDCGDGSSAAPCDSPKKIRRIRSARLSRLPLAAATASEPAICSGSRSRMSTSSTRADPSGTENPKPGRSFPPGRGHRKPLTIMTVNHMIIPWRRAVTPPGNQGGRSPRTAFGHIRRIHFGAGLSASGSTAPLPVSPCVIRALRTRKRPKSCPRNLNGRYGSRQPAQLRNRKLRGISRETG